MRGQGDVTEQDPTREYQISVFYNKAWSAQFSDTFFHLPLKKKRRRETLYRVNKKITGVT